jgi:UDP-N-acetyl-D-glucosamine/UDP-N-acetyl-D-galactosamine dehydrogenase
MISKKELLAHKETIGIVGLGYVGLPLAALFAEKYKVIGLEIDQSRIDELEKGFDRTQEVDMSTVNKDNLEYTIDSSRLSECKFVYVTVPTPIDQFHNPDPSPVTKATAIIGQHMTKDTTVIYESTVYPGLTEELCIPILEEESKLKWKEDFYVCFSPERVNPGDKKNTVQTIAKVVGGDTEETTENISQIYEEVIDAEIYRAPSIKTAEAAKVVENAQRDVNIAFVNEIALLMDRLGVDTSEVIKAMNTKWNALGFTPGLVGGHCIGVDPYYLIQKAREVGITPEIMLSTRHINESIAPHIGNQLVKMLASKDLLNTDTRVLIMGITFKPDVPDLRNTKVVDIGNVLKEYSINVDYIDSHADSKHAKHELDIDLLDSIGDDYSAKILAVDHKEYIKTFTKFENLVEKLLPGGIIIDVKSLVSTELQQRLAKEGYQYWSL